MSLSENFQSHYKKKTLALSVMSKERCTYLNQFMTDLAKRIWVDFGTCEFLDIYKFNWYEALYLTCSSLFRHLDFIGAIRMIFCSFQYGALLMRGICLYKFLKFWVLYNIIAFTKQIKIPDLTLTRIRLLLLMEAVEK